MEIDAEKAEAASDDEDVDEETKTDDGEDVDVEVDAAEDADGTRGAEEGQESIFLND